MSDQYFLSVIIPVYNVQSYVGECLQSVIDQNLDDFEIIIVNDGSTDDSLEICKKFSENYPNITIINQKNVGLSAARKKGLKNAKGKFVYFIDSDDFISAGYFPQILTYIQEHNVDFVGFQVRRTTERYNRTDAKSIEVASEYNSGIDLLNHHNFNNGVWWYIFKRESLGNLTFKEGHLCEDGIFTAELLQNMKKAVVLKNVIYNYFINENSIVKTNNLQRSNQIIKDMFFAALYFNDIIDLLPKHDQNYNKAFLRLRERQESYVFYGFIRLLKLNKNYSEFKNYISYVNKGTYKPYPMLLFKDFDSKKYKVLLQIFNKKLFLRALILFNKVFKVIR